MDIGATNGLQRLTQLTELQLRECKLNDTSLFQLSSLTQMRVLDLSRTMVNAPALPCLGYLTRLEVLRFSTHLPQHANTAICEPLSKLVKLVELQWSDVRSLDIVHISTLTKLERVLLWNVDTTSGDFLTSIARLKSLRHLELWKVLPIDNLHITSLARLTCLCSLIVGGLQDAAMQDVATLTTLRKLDLSTGNDGLTHESVSALYSLSSLWELCLPSHCGCGETFNRLLSTLTQLTKLNH